MISFDIEALALEHVTGVQGLAEGLRGSFWAVADDMPGGSLPIRPASRRRSSCRRGSPTRPWRLRYFGDRVAAAIEHRYDRAQVEQELAEVFPEELPGAPRSERADFARTLREGNTSAKVKLALGAGRSG